MPGMASQIKICPKLYWMTWQWMGKYVRCRPCKEDTYLVSRSVEGAGLWFTKFTDEEIDAMMTDMFAISTFSPVSTKNIGPELYALKVWGNEFPMIRVLYRLEPIHCRGCVGEFGSRP